ncbi:MAG: chemotaxis protein CheA [Alphaproteobacteria bacterium]
MSGDEITEEFRQEAQELLAQMEAALLDLEKTPSDSNHINTVFRALHTLKGSSGMFGFDDVSTFAHHVETAFDRVRQGNATATAELIAVALRAQDHMRTLMKTPSEADADAGATIIAALEAAFESGAQSSQDQQTEIPVLSACDVETAWTISIRLPQDSFVKGVNPLPILDELRTLGQICITPVTAGIPALQELDPSCCYLGWDVELTTTQPRSAIEGAFILLGDEASVEVNSQNNTAESEAGQTASASSKQDQSPADETTAQVSAAPAAAEVQQTAQQQPQGQQQQNKSGNSIRVPAERLDDLMDRVGELVIAQSRLRQIANNSVEQQVKSVAEEIERLVLELRDTSMCIRMVPIVQLFGRFRRVVHDLSRDVGKQVELTMSGEETELDKTVIEQLNDPLVHLIRNSIDHGLEDGEERANAGKRETGRIALSARHAGTEVLITISDDGRGLDRDRIRKRAEERGLVAPDEVLSDNELFQVLFMPGFSTAQSVTNLSGRGVGMDVVKRTIEALRGKIDITSTTGQGTEITLRLPLTLAIIDGLMVRIGKARYVLPLEAVEECVELSEEDDARSRGRCFLNIRGDLVPFLRLRDLFAINLPPDRFQKVVVVSWSGQKVGLVVDQVIGDHQTVIKSLSKLHSGIGMFSGATILGDGAVALILDIQHLVEYGETQEERLKAAS